MIKLLDKTFTIFIQEEDIQRRVLDGVDWLEDQVGNELPVIIPVLNGALPFTADLVKHSTKDFDWIPIQLRSYEGMQSTGRVEVISGDLNRIKGRKVFIIEDIIDTGRSMRKLLKELKQYEPEEVHILTLLLKPEALEVPINAGFVGFEIENEFVVGYGMDYNQYGRGLSDIYIHQTKE